jgi:hypothetical protein
MVTTISKKPARVNYLKEQRELEDSQRKVAGFVPQGYDGAPLVVTSTFVR